MCDLKDGYDNLPTADEPKPSCDSAMCGDVQTQGLATEYTNAQIDRPAIAALCRQLLMALGENPDRAGLLDTPRRWANWWGEFVNYDSGKTDTLFENHVSDSLVVVSGMRVYSLCEHHLLPFWADVTIAYKPNGHVLGLSKFARVAHKYAHKLGTQEGLVEDIHHHLCRVIKSRDVMVMAAGVHTCMIMRGIKTDGRMTTIKATGAFESLEYQQLVLRLTQ